MRPQKNLQALSMARKVMGFAYPFLLAALSLLAWKANSNGFSDSIRVIQTHESFDSPTLYTSP